MEPQIHILSFEGPDPYARAGGIASRITGLSYTLADLGFETHLWFVGDPNLPGHQIDCGVHLHRWCQWISRYHPQGVYDGEDGKQADYARSLPPHLMQEVLRPHLERGGRAVVLAEEWQTCHAVLHLDGLLCNAGLRDQVPILWNANNTFGFERIDWARLSRAALITTVSRYMKHVMQPYADALVIPNGLNEEAFHDIPTEAVAEFRRRFSDRTVITKMARFDPDKRWLMAVEIVAELKRAGWKPLLIARGGLEAHGADVTAAAQVRGLRIVERTVEERGVSGMLRALGTVNGADMVVIQSPVDWEGRRLLFGESSAVLANSSHEPFGLVGLEAMAAGGIACTGCSGEDYAVPGHNALVLQTSDPGEFVGMFTQLKRHAEDENGMRSAGRSTAEQYAWPRVVRRSLIPRLEVVQPGFVQDTL